VLSFSEIFLNPADTHLVDCFGSRLFASTRAEGQYSEPVLFRSFLCPNNRLQRKNLAKLLLSFVVDFGPQSWDARVNEGPQSHALIRFGVFELDTESGELRKQGVKVRLQEQPFQILQILLDRPGRVVTREELQRRIWPSDTFVDFDTGLYNAIKRLREALGDSAESPRFIETLSRRGYRFIAAVKGAAADRHTAPALSATHDSIVVLPFISISADSENEFFADGITEEIINALAQIRELHVVARSSAFSFKGKHIDPRVVGEQLNVRTVLEGSVRRVDNRLRITVQLVNAADGYHLWSQRYDREMKDIFEIQDEIARSIAERLRVRLERHEQEPLIKATTSNLEAFQLYLKGRALLYKRGIAIPRALECFKQAVALDNEYALAWAGLADSYTTLGYSGFAHPAASMPNGIEAARRAVMLDPSLAEAHSALAMACLMGMWDKAKAEQEFLCALELSPRNIQARDWYALYYLQLSEGRVEEGVTQARLALESDPLSAYANTLFGFTCCVAGRYAEGLQACERAVELDSESFLARWAYHFALYFSQRFEEAVAVGELAAAMSGRNPWAMGTLAAVLADWGKPSDAEAIYAELMGRVRRSYISPAMLAMTAAAAGLRDQAIRHAREAFQIRDPMSQCFLTKLTPAGARLLAEPRFHQIPVDMGWLLK
jgi:adenylate cyclase